LENKETIVDSTIVWTSTNTNNNKLIETGVFLGQLVYSEFDLLKKEFYDFLFEKVKYTSQPMIYNNIKSLNNDISSIKRENYSDLKIKSNNIEYFFNKGIKINKKKNK
jgi:hypothetical protein